MRSVGHGINSDGMAYNLYYWCPNIIYGVNIDVHPLIGIKKYFRIDILNNTYL